MEKNIIMEKHYNGKTLKWKNILMERQYNGKTLMEQQNNSCNNDDTCIWNASNSFCETKSRTFW